MLIVNDSDTDASWFCYNSDDGIRAIALASGDLSAKGGRFSYSPPNNRTGEYTVEFTRKGGAGHRPDEPSSDYFFGRAWSVGQSGQTVRLTGSLGNHGVSVSKGEATGTGYPIG
ncbi:MAG: hypothetical protein ACREJ0_20315 [Geminicoccaceae bacterium]